jgi:probable phosphomutase (TIGR03848 family)
VPTVLLVRHGRTAANAGGILAGWTPGVGLDETGQAQAKTLAARLEQIPVKLTVASPLQRCQETAAALVPSETVLTDDRLGECRYGDWTGRPLKELAQDKLWPVVQAHPSAMVFPGPEGESMLDMQHRAVAAIRAYDARVAAEFGDHAVWMAVSHGDVIKAILADALGMHLDQFQRLVVDPCSVSVIRFTPLRPFAVRVNDSGTDLAALVPVEPPAGEAGAAESDAVVGGGAGGAAAPSGTS